MLEIGIWCAGSNYAPIATVKKLQLDASVYTLLQTPIVIRCP